MFINVFSISLKINQSRKMHILFRGELDAALPNLVNGCDVRSRTRSAVCAMFLLCMPVIVPNWDGNGYPINKMTVKKTIRSWRFVCLILLNEIQWQ